MHGWMPKGTTRVPFVARGDTDRRDAMRFLRNVVQRGEDSYAVSCRNDVRRCNAMRR